MNNLFLMLLFDQLPLCMVMIFLIVTLLVGLYYSDKTTTLRAYAVGDKQFSTLTLVATTLATSWGGGQLVRDVEQVYDRGLYWMIFSCLSFADVWILIPLSLRMGGFIQHFSMPESMGSVYGKYPRFITALAGIASSIAIIASQINVMSLAISKCIETEQPIYIGCTTVAAALILIFYSTFGGIRAVTFTDVLQFVTFSAVIPLFTWFMFRQTGKSINDIAIFIHNQPKFQFSYVFHFDRNLFIMLSMVLGIMAAIDPTTMQRIYMASSPRQANKVFLYSGLFSFLMIGCIIVASLFVFVSMPTLSTAEVWPYIMNHIPSVFKGCICISLLAMTMSTADSKLNTCSVMVSHDIVESIKQCNIPLFQSSSLRFMVQPLQWLARLIENTSPIWLARLTSIVVGLCAMLLAFCCKDLLALLMLAIALYVPIVTAPFVLALFGFRGSSQTALIGMITGIVAILAWNRWIKPITGMDGSFFCMLANGLAMLAAHYLLPQPAGTGWVSPDQT
ncbi:sodium:solute symporter family protein [Candidatus Cardinium hertigii]|uniref:Sodium:solute symporter family protein n=1 Tax=Candidatus Cardinium hertigii TaxID=247481 RepID=A0A2Z3LI37_9BACT|nr:sodium:solute symporter family protein [Candidatus Cardinium hertigii]AWN81720.1 hypothetical protein DK880_00392 [Candidatus Cardinium hertigii]